MPQRNSDSRRTLFRLVLFALAGGALLALARRQQRANSRRHETVAAAPAARAWDMDAPVAMKANGHRRGAKRRVAASLAFTPLFFAGAAFSAGAGDQVAKLLETNAEAVPTAADDVPPPDGVCTEEEKLLEQAPDCEDIPPQEPAEETPAAEEIPPGEPSPATPEEEPAAETPAQAPADPDAPSDETNGGAEAPAGPEAPAPVDPAAPEAPAPAAEPASPASGSPASTSAAPVDDGAPVVKPYRPEPNWAPQPDPEVDQPGTAATIWLRRDLPDPTPPARRLSPAFAKQLARVARVNRVDWALMLGVLRAHGLRNSEPATAPALQRLATRLRAHGARTDAWQAVLALVGRTAFADRALALRHYNRAVGLRGLVTGLEAAKPSLERRLLGDDRVDIYAGGRGDVQSHRIDVRVLVLLAYLAEAHGQVTVSSLHSGHRLFARPGVVSAHIYGLAVDISMLENKTIFGNQQPGGVTERAVRNILLLPVELRPQQIISLLGLGGASFPLSNHHDHIHVGY
ncbi:MAG TPA: hypothetical protein VG079_03020 [Gaiellaceae bacterium]|nr:hypothetical protein [Gaiellaceae bacterium]